MKGIWRNGVGDQGEVVRGEGSGRQEGDEKG